MFGRREVALRRKRRVKTAAAAGAAEGEAAGERLMGARDHRKLSRVSRAWSRRLRRKRKGKGQGVSPRRNKWRKVRRGNGRSRGWTPRSTAICRAGRESIIILSVLSFPCSQCAHLPLMCRNCLFSGNGLEQKQTHFVACLIGSFRPDTNGRPFIASVDQTECCIARGNHASTPGRLRAPIQAPLQACR